MKKHSLLFLMCITLMFTVAKAQKTYVYKKTDSLDLKITVQNPTGFDTAKKYPAIVFYFGGGWNSGSISQFKKHAAYFASRGMVAIQVDYRVRNRNNTTPFDALKDAKSAMRFVKKHAKELHIDSSKIVAAGGSAGGYLAAATGSIEKFNTLGDDLSITTKPAALVLYNPVIDNGPGGYGYDRIQDKYKDFSVLHNLEKGVPPTVFFLGTEDHLIPVETAKYYQKVIQKLKGRCDLHLYEGQKHSFFNYKNHEYYVKTVKETDLFLQSLGILSQKAELEIN